MIGPAVANHWLSRETWMRERLATHGGRSFAIAVGPFFTTLAIDAAGMVATPSDAQPPDVTLRVSPFDVPTLLADPTRWGSLVEVEGDEALAATLGELAQTLPWFVERTFASALGPIVGQRVADAGRAMLAFPAYAASRFADGLASYASDEAGIATRGIELQLFVEQVATLASRVDALARKVDEIDARAASATLR